MADEKTTFKLDLDAKEFVAALGEAQGKLSAFGDAKNLAGLVSSLDKLIPLAGALGVAFTVLKGTFDAVFEAENIKAINQQFEALTKNAGLSTEALRKGLERASEGLIDTTDLMQIANRSIVAMGSSAEKLPEIMQLARKASVLTGGDIKDTFEQITQAVSTGNLRMLKHMGIVIDADKAYQAFAKSQGISVEALSEAGKRQAILNEVLDKGNTALAGVDTTVKEMTDTWQQLKVTFNDLREAFLLFFEKTIGPTLREVLKDVSYFAQRIKLWFERDTSNAFDKARERLKKLREESAQPIKGPGGATNTGESAIDLDKQKELRARFEKEIVALRKDRMTALAALSTTEVEMNRNFSEQRLLLEQDTEAKIAMIRANKGLTTRQQAAEELAIRQNLSLQLQALDNERANRMSEFRMKRQEELLAMATTETQVNQALQNERDIAAEQAFQKKQLITQSEVLSDEQKAEQIAFIEENLAQRISDINNRSFDARKSAYDNEVRRANTAADQIALGFTNASRKAAIEAQNFTKIGEVAFNRFTGNVSNAFVQVGMGAKSLGDAMREAVLGALADEAIARGQLLIASSIFPPNPVGLGAGAGLLALGGVLKAAAGGGSSLSGGAAGGGAGGVGGITQTQNPTEPLRPDAAASEVPKKSVVLNIQGSYFDTEQTRTRLIEIVREASDATALTIQSVGGGF